MNAGSVVGYNYGYMWSLYSFTCFVVGNYFLRLFVPIHSLKSEHLAWKWKNIAISFVHSSISGGWVVFCLWRTPEYRDDLINVYTVSAHGLTALSIGYFFYDLLDMALNDLDRSKDLLLHHTVVIISLGLSMTTRYYQGYVLLSLLVEINSIFLHIRQLMLMHGISKSTTMYHINAAFNLGTFLMFRVVTMAGMLQWLLANRTLLSATVFSIGIIATPLILVMNMQLLLKILKADYGIRGTRALSDSTGGQREKPETEKYSNRSHAEYNVTSDMPNGLRQVYDVIEALKNGNMSSNMNNGGSVISVTGIDTINGKAVKVE